jgi:anti-sigma factor RsiW
MTANARRLSSAVLHQLVVPSEPWLSCEDCFELMDAYVDARLADPSFPAPAMDVHLGACPACAEEAVSLTVLVAQEDNVDPEPALRRIRSRT